MELLAKSNPHQTLKRHIDDALKIEQYLENSFPNINKVNCTDDFWELLKICIIFHDLGKAHSEFQKLLQGKSYDWKQQRHELFSLPFVKSLKNQRKELIYLVIAGHHKDYETLIKNLESYCSDNDDFELDISGTEEISTFEKEFENNVPVKKVHELLKYYGVEIKAPVIHNPKKQLQQFVKKHFIDKNEQIKLLLLTGAFKQCDHLASSGVEKIFNLYSY